MYLKTKTEHKTIWEKVTKNIKSRIAGVITNHMPISFGLEISNACNANCTFCAYRFQTREKGIMEMSVFKRAIDQYCTIGGGDLNMTPTVGDPLVDRNLIEKIRYARSKPEINEIWFYTNMIAFDHFDVQEFLESGLTSMRISTCIKDKETYVKIYRSPKYEQMIENIITLMTANPSATKPLNVMLFLRIPKPFQEVLDSVDYQRVAALFDKKNIIHLDDEYDSWGGLIDAKDLPAGNQLYENKLDQTKEPCSELYRRVNVLFDGTVNNCVCRDLNADMKIGNIYEQSLEEIWNGKELKELRSQWHKGVVPKTCQGCQRYVPVSDYFSSHFFKIVKKFLRRKFLIRK